MTCADAQHLALALPEACEGAHKGHADCRVRGKIFATLRHEDGRAAVKLAPDRQEVLAAAEPAALAPIPGHWSRQGWTWIVLAASDEPPLRGTLAMAWRNVPPKRLALAAAPGAGA